MAEIYAVFNSSGRVTGYTHNPSFEGGSVKKLELLDNNFVLMDKVSLTYWNLGLTVIPRYKEVLNPSRVGFINASDGSRSYTILLPSSMNLLIPAFQRLFPLLENGVLIERAKESKRRARISNEDREEILNHISLALTNIVTFKVGESVETLEDYMRCQK